MPKPALLKTLHPEVFKQLHPTLNKALGIDVDSLMCISDEIVVWYCPNSKCYHQHVYWRSVNDKLHRSKNCLYCTKSTAKRKVCLCNSFAIQRPDLLDEYDWEENNKCGYNPYELSLGSNYEIKWICSKHTTCQHKWTTSIKARSKANYGCPYCSNQYVCECNSLLNTRPDLVKEFDQKLNPGIDLNFISHGSRVSIMWKCSMHRGCEEHVWISEVVDRSREGYRCCPFCSFNRACSCRNFLKLFPKIYEEVDKENNPGIDCTKLSPYSNVKINWKCSVCSHKWIASVNNRNGKGSTGCPKCSQNQSHMEKECERVLKELKISYIREAYFSDCKDKRILYFDFGIFNDEGMIELDGYQHFFEVAFFRSSLEEIQRRDGKKNDYCKEKGKGLLRISYTEIKNIEQHVTNYIQEIREGKRPIRFIGKEYIK